MSDSNSVTYINTSTNETRTLEEMVAAGWVELSEDDHGDTYQYPAIYSMGSISNEYGAPIHAALDMSDGDQVGDWIAIAASSDSSSTETTDTTTDDSAETTDTTTDTTDDSADTSSVTYINTSTNETRTLEEMVAAGWIELSEDSYGDAYQYPAIYSNGTISDENGPIRAALDMSDGDQVGDWIAIAASSDSASSETANISGHQIGTSYQLEYIKDYDGNLHANSDSVSDELKSSYKYHGNLDVNNDGIEEAIYTNKISGRWVTAEIDIITGEIDYSDHGENGSTRVVGIYDDPLIAVGLANGGYLDDGVTPAPASFDVSDADRYLDLNGDGDFNDDNEDRLALNSQVRFQNDLLNDNLSMKESGDYDGDGLQEVYWKTVDDTAYLRALMHADGNIQYANYQNEEQMIDYLTGNGNEGVIGDII